MNLAVAEVVDVTKDEGASQALAPMGEEQPPPPGFGPSWRH